MRSGLSNLSTAGVCPGMTSGNPFLLWDSLFKKKKKKKKKENVVEIRILNINVLTLICAEMGFDGSVTL